MEGNKRDIKKQKNFDLPTIPTSAPLMPNPATLPNPSIPWMMSPGVFQRIQTANTNDSYKKCEITNNDPEWSFVQSYFASHPPEMSILWGFEVLPFLSRQNL